MKHIKELKLNEDKKMVDPYFEGARTKIQELAKYLGIQDKVLMETIWYGHEENEKVISLAYSFGLI